MLLIITSELWAFRGLHWFLGSGEGRGGKRLGSWKCWQQLRRWALGKWGMVKAWGGVGFTWWWRGPHPTEFTDPAQVRLEVGTDLSSYTWTFEGAPSPPLQEGWLLLGNWDYSGSTNSKHSLAFIMSQALFQVLTCIGLIQSWKQPRRHVLLLTPLVIKKWKNKAQRG